MKAEQAKKLAEQGIANLATALEQGKSAALEAYLLAMSRFHRYSFSNIMLIASQRPDATRVAGFRSWKKLNRHVKRGEKGIVIIAPMVIRPKDGEQRSADDERDFLRFKAVHVFDISQTDGEPLPEFASVRGNPYDSFTQLREYAVREHNIIAVVDDLPPGVDGESSGGKIRLRPGLDPAEHFHVFAHELAHELLHQSTGDRPQSKTVRETEAEAVAFVVCQAIGLDTNTAACDYIQLHAGDKDTLAASLDRIQRTAATLIEVLTSSE